MMRLFKDGWNFQMWICSNPKSNAKINGERSRSQVSDDLSKHRVSREAFTSSLQNEQLWLFWGLLQVVPVVGYTAFVEWITSQILNLPTHARRSTGAPYLLSMRAFPRYRINDMHDYAKTEGIWEGNWADEGAGEEQREADQARRQSIDTSCRTKKWSSVADQTDCR